MLTSAQLAICQAVQAKALDQVAQVYRAGQTRDSGGGETAVWAPAGDPLPCRLWSRLTPRDIRLEQIAGKIMPITEWIALLPTGSDARAGDRLQIDGDMFDVIGADADHSDPINLGLLLRKTLDGC